MRKSKEAKAQLKGEEQNFCVSNSLCQNRIFNMLILKHQILKSSNSLRNGKFAHKTIIKIDMRAKHTYSNHLLLSSISSLYALPCFDFSISEKMAYLLKQKIFAREFVNNWFNEKNRAKVLFKNKHSEFGNTIQEPFLFPYQRFENNIESFSSFPVSKNQWLFKKNDLIGSNSPFANTSFLSPIEGEMLTNPSNIWFSEFDAFRTQNRYLLLTNSDLFCLSLKNPLLKKNQYDNFELSYSKCLNKNLSFDKNAIKLSKIQKYSNYENLMNTIFSAHQHFQKLEETSKTQFLSRDWLSTTTIIRYKNKFFKIKGLRIGKVNQYHLLRVGSFLIYGDIISFTPSIDNSIAEETLSEKITKQKIQARGTDQAGQIIHMNSSKITLRYAQPISASPKGILHAYNGDFVNKNTAVITLPFETLKTGDIVQGIPKVEQYFESRTTKQGRLFRDSLPNLLQGIFERYCSLLPLEAAVQQSFLKIQQIIVDGVQRVYRSQGVSIADKHLEVIVRQMTSKVQIVYGGQTGFFPGELIDLEFIERVNRFLVNKIQYEPIILGITRASLEVDSFLSAASFQQTTKVLSKAAIYKKKDFLKGLKENLLVGNLIPGGTGYLVYLQDLETH